MVVLAGTSSTVNSNNSNYKNNTADRHGGVVAIFSGSVFNSTNDHFENNQAGSDGGIVSMLSRLMLSPM